MNEVKAEAGLIGLGVMGSNLALNIAEKGFRLAVFDREGTVISGLMETAGSLTSHLVPKLDLEAFVKAIKKPRSIILLIKAGSPVDDVVEMLLPHLDDGDTIIDGGNSEFGDTVRRSIALAPRSIYFVGLGVSGGEKGARHGPSLMFGGSQHSWNQVSPLLNAISAKYEGQPCSAYMGENGAGNFVKTIHNGIEYADMQMIAEVYGLLRDGFGKSATNIGEIFESWNEGAINSYLVEITAKVLKKTDDKTGQPLVDLILDSAGQKGTGRWAVIEAQKLGVSATTLEAAVSARIVSSHRQQRGKASKALEFDLVAARQALAKSLSVGDLERALLIGKITAYAQGFAVLSAASKTYKWNLPLSDIAKIWRAGCIIRSSLLNKIASAFSADRQLENLLESPAFIEEIQFGQSSLRATVSAGISAGLPIPALSAAVSYLDGIRQGRSTANLLQGQRDYFGAHTFERLDLEGPHRGDWD